MLLIQTFKFQIFSIFIIELLKKKKEKKRERKVGRFTSHIGRLDYSYIHIHIAIIDYKAILGHDNYMPPCEKILNLLSNPIAS